MKIISYLLGQLKVNCYFLIKDNQCLIIDPADDGTFILEELQRRRLNLIGILATHGHFDHIMAVGEIQESINIPLYINEKDYFLVKRIKETAEYFLGFKQLILPIKNFKNLNNNLTKISNFEFKIIETPGHTPGSISIYFPDEKIVFTGDTLFKGSIGRYDFSYSDKNLLKKSLKRLLKLPEETIVYPGHGEKTTITDERKTLFNFF